jgi:hypothetical protein
MLKEIVELPSKGKLYPKEHPLSTGKVEIKYMTAKEEDILTTQSYIQEGIMLDKLLDSVILTEGVSSKDLIIGDRQKLLVQTRVLGYGAEYNFIHEGKKYTYDLSEVRDKGNPDLFNNTPYIDYELPRSKRKIKLKILNSEESNDLSKEMETLEKKGIIVGEITTRLNRIIDSVDGNDDNEYIRKFVHEELLAADSLAIRMFMDMVVPTIDLVTEINGQEVDIPIGMDFFYPTT